MVDHVVGHVAHHGVVLQGVRVVAYLAAHDEGVHVVALLAAHDGVRVVVLLVAHVVVLAAVLSLHDVAEHGLVFYLQKKIRIK